MNRFRNKRTGILDSVDLRTKENKVIYFLMLACVLLVSITTLLPCVWILLSAFKDTTEFYAVPPRLFPSKIDLSKLMEIWRRFDIQKYYLNSIILAVGEIVFTIVCCASAGYVLSRLKPKGTTLVFLVLFWCMMIPASLRFVPLFTTFMDFPVLHINMLDSYLPMFFMAGANAYNILLFRSYFNGIPMTYIEAARIDGCRDIGAFARIILPLSKPILVVVAIFTFNGSWGSFLFPYLILKDPNKIPIGVKLFQLGTTIAIDKYLMVVLFSILPPVIIFSIFSKQIMGGLTMDGIKG